MNKEAVYIMKKILAVLIAFAAAIGVTPAPADDPEPPMNILYASGMFRVIYQVYQKTGDIPAGYVIAPQKIYAEDKASGIKAKYRISNPDAPDTTGDAVYRRYTEEEMEANGAKWPQDTLYYVTCAEAEPDENGEWNAITGIFGFIVTKMTADPETAEWMQKSAAEYYALFRENGNNPVKYESDYQGNEFTVSMRSGETQFSFVFEYTPYKE